MKGRELYSDRQGRSFSHSKPLRHAYSEETSLSELTMETFARRLADFLEHARIKESFGELILVAEPKFLATLRPLLDSETRRRVVMELDKNLGRSKFLDVQNQVDVARFG